MHSDYFLPFELEPQVEERYWLHYTDSEGFEDWLHDDEEDREQIKGFIAENAIKGTAWKIERVPMD